jgi:hypothetical protein
MHLFSKKSLWMRLVGGILLVGSAGGTTAWAQDDWDDDWEEEVVVPIEIHGFLESAGSARIVNDPTASDDYLLGEARFRLDLSHFGERSELSFKGDFIHDVITDETLIDIRQAWVALRTGKSLDWRLGRQVLTWGTGDLLFLNDLFPKDFVSFFIGRDDEFLKAPSNTLKGSVYSSAINLDVAWTPVFTPDRFITGERLSFTAVGEPVGPDSPQTPVVALEPDKTLENGEWALRAHRRLGSVEAAAYGYWGHFKRPTAFDSQAQLPTYARLGSGGASVRGNLLGGLYNLEGTYYGSLDDRDGTDPLVPNSQVRGLVGYERELRANLTLGVQYYAEWLQNHSELLDNSPNPGLEPVEVRHLGTIRLTSRLMQETLTLSLFGFVSLNEGDSHWRPAITRQWTDHVQVSAGANVMVGSGNTFFGQLSNNTNAYLRVRYSL